MPSVASRGKNGRARRGTVEQHVFDAVERLLAGGESFTALGVQRIADEAGIARSSFYMNFTDKSDLLMRLSEAATRDLFGVAEQWLAGEGALTRDGLHATFMAIIREYRRHAPALNAMNEVAGYDPEVAAFWRERITRFAAGVAARLEFDRAAGRVADDVDPAFTAHWVAWGAERSVSQHVAAGGTDDERLAGAVCRSVWWSLYGGA